MSKTVKKISGDFPFSIKIAQYVEHVQWNCNQVIHPTWLFFWNPAPGARIIDKDHEFEADEKFAYLIPDCTTISGYSRNEFPHLYSHIEIGGEFQKVRKQIYQLDAAPARRFFEEHLHLEPRRRELYWRIMLLEYLAMLPAEAFTGEEHSVDERILKALEIASQKSYLHVDNRKLAKAVGMSENNFYRCFRKVMKITPGHYFLSMRLNIARQALLDPEYSIEDVAEKCGFADRYQFSKSFKQFFGIAPGKFRRQDRIKKSNEVEKN